MENNKSSKRPRYVIAFKITALISSIFGIGLISICLWVLIALSDHDLDVESSRNNPTALGFRIVSIILDQQSKDKGENKGRSTFDNSRLKNETKSEQTIEKFQASWSSVSPYFKGSCGLALFLGLLQLISCMVILSSSTKGAMKQSRAKVWKIIQLIISMSLLICLLIPVTIDQTQKDGGIKMHLEALKKHLNRYEHKGELDVEDVDNMELFYAMLIVDSVGIILTVISTHIALKFLKKNI